MTSSEDGSSLDTDSDSSPETSGASYAVQLLAQVLLICLKVKQWGWKTGSLRKNFSSLA